MLSDRTVAHLKPKSKPYRRADEKGLYVQVNVTGARCWRWKYTFGGRERTLSLGVYPEIKLSEARTARDDARKLLRAGMDPSAAKKAAKRAQRSNVENTLAKVAERYHAQIKGRFRNEKHGTQWLQSLRVHVFPRLGGHGIATIDAQDLLDLLVPLSEKRPETARRIRQRLELVLADAHLRGLVENNVASLIRKALGRRDVQTVHLRAPSYKTLPKFLSKLRADQRTSDVVRAAFEFLIVTNSRTGEVLGARWPEVDLDGRTWTVPAARMKAGREHRVYLSERALELLKLVEPFKADNNGLVFPSLDDPGKPLSGGAFLMAVRRLGFRDTATPHGLARTCFSTWAHEMTSYRSQIIEASLAHGDENRVRASYNRATYEAQRRALSEAWGRYCTTAPAEAKVVNIKQRRGAA